MTSFSMMGQGLPILISRHGARVNADRRIRLKKSPYSVMTPEMQLQNRLAEKRLSRLLATMG